MRNCRHRRTACFLAFCCFLLHTPLSANAAVVAEAFSGRPFGVGRITVPLAQGAETRFDNGGFALVERDGRVYYPVLAGGRILRVLQSLLGNEEPSGPPAVTAYFLFTGDAPLRLTLFAPGAHTVDVAPRAQGRLYDRLLKRWWRQYHLAAKDQQDEGDYPPILQTYLTTSLSHRLGLKPPLGGRTRSPEPTPPEKSLDLLMGTEKLRAAVMQDTLDGRYADGEQATLPLPRAIRWTPLALPTPADDVDVEPIAAHVPEECFYVRFGRFSNYLWLNHLIEDNGGDLSRMITLRGLDSGSGRRQQTQLVLQESALAELLGEAVIADVALIGRDLFVREGAAIGVLFQARNGVLLKSDIEKQRAAALKREKENGAESQTVRIGGRDVSLLATPDNRIRSFYAIDGDFHLVTTSGEIVRRFFEAGAGRGSLGASQEFQHARILMPTERKDTVFIFMSSAFFRGLVSPQYRIELQRRVRAVTDIELFHLGRLAARGEKKPHETIDDLVRAGVLPRGFSRRPDGSEPVIRDGEIIDSLRGARGTFTPVPDVPIQLVTPSEAEQYEAVATFHEHQWQQMDPIMAGIRRYALGGERMERIVIDARMSPFMEKKYGQLASRMGPPLKNQIAPVPGDIISVQAVMTGGPQNPEVGVHHLFLGVQDADSPVEIRRGGLLTILRVIQSTPGYLGAWPKPGYVDRLPLGLAGQVDEWGYSALPLGIWRRQFDGFSVLSGSREVLETVTPHLHLEKTLRAAQVRLRVGDLSRAKISSLANSFAYLRARQASHGNTRLLHALSQQLHVPREEAMDTAQTLLDAKLVCSLGGEYQLVQLPGGLKQWVSTGWADEAGAAENHRAPILDWFRGLDADLLKADGQLILHAQLDMQRKKKEPMLTLPLFDLFGRKKNAGEEKPPTDERPETNRPESDPKREF